VVVSSLTVKNYLWNAERIQGPDSDKYEKRETSDTILPVPERNAEIHIRIPEIHTISADRIFELNVTGLHQESLHVQCSHVFNFLFGQLQIGSLILDFPEMMISMISGSVKQIRWIRFFASIHGQWVSPTRNDREI